MGIPDEDIARVRAATDIVALIGEHAALKRQGRRWVGLCPFHGEKTPSFSVNAEDGFYYCFGCQAKGDAISFVRAMEHLDFVDAVRRLADRAGVTITEDAEAGRDAHRRKALMAAMEAAVEWYHQRLLTGADGGLARDYLRSRGYDSEVVRRFRLGWAPDEWDALSAALSLDGDLAEGTGLGFTNRRGRLQDAFRARVIFPICDPSGRPVALGGRVLPGAGDPAKYKNSRETPIYSKSRVLYGLNWAKDDVIRSGEVVVCEGYTDVIGFFEAGVPRAVATCGTALADDHFRLLRNFAKRVVLAYDADGAGQAAATRFYEWERRHEVDVAVADLPAGADPADLARRDPGGVAGGGQGGQAVSAVPVGAHLGRRRPVHAGGPGQGGRRRPGGRGRAPRRPGTGPLRHAGGGDLPPRAVGPSGPAGADSEGGAETGPGRPAEGARRPPAGRAPRGRPVVGAGPRRVGRVRRGEGRPPGPGERDPGPRSGLEALRLAIHRPGRGGRPAGRIAVLRPLQRAAYEALATSVDLHEAIDGAPPEVRDLLVRLAVEEPVGRSRGCSCPWCAKPPVVSWPPWYGRPGAQTAPTPPT